MTRRFTSGLALLSLCVVAHVLVGAQAPQIPTTQAPPAVAPGPQTTLAGELTFAAGGDSILLRPISVYEKDPAFAGLLALMRNATVSFTNFEMSVFDTRK